MRRWNWWSGVEPQTILVDYSGVATPKPGCPPPD
jgi:hypothetical protein